MVSFRNKKNYPSVIIEYSLLSRALCDSTIKTKKIGLPRLTTIVVLSIKQFDLTMQQYFQKI